MKRRCLSAQEVALVGWRVCVCLPACTCNSVRACERVWGARLRLDGSVAKPDLGRPVGTVGPRVIPVARWRAGGLCEQSRGRSSLRSAFHGIRRPIFVRLRPLGCESGPSCAPLGAERARVQRDRAHAPPRLVTARLAMPTSTRPSTSGTEGLERLGVPAGRAPQEGSALWTRVRWWTAGPLDDAVRRPEEESPELASRWRHRPAAGRHRSLPSGLLPRAAAGNRAHPRSQGMQHHLPHTMQTAPPCLSLAPLGPRATLSQHCQLSCRTRARQSPGHGRRRAGSGVAVPHRPTSAQHGFNWHTSSTVRGPHDSEPGLRGGCQ